MARAEGGTVGMADRARLVLGDELNITVKNL